MGAGSTKANSNNVGVHCDQLDPTQCVAKLTLAQAHLLMLSMKKKGWWSVCGERVQMQMKVGQWSPLPPSTSPYNALCEIPNSLNTKWIL